jgi:hypothetical protein
MQHYIFGSNRLSDLHLLHSHSQCSHESLLFFLSLFTIHCYCATFFGSGRCLLTYATGILFAFPSYPSHIPFLIPFFSFFFFLCLCASRGAGRGTGRDLLPLLHAPIPLRGLPLPLLLLLLLLCRSHLLGIPR